MNSEALKKEQKEIILDFILANDVFAVLPTGFRKSLCYACLPGIFNLTVLEALTLWL